MDNASILASALKHGYTPQDIAHALNVFLKDHIERTDPRKVVRIGYDTHGRLLEIGFMDYGDQIVVFHAMKARRRYIDW